jgi:hypothetical protein
MFASKSFINNVESCYIGKRKDWIALSDHMPFFAELRQTGFDGMKG